MAELFGTLGEMKDKNFVSGGYPIRTENGSFADKTDLKAGTVVAKGTDGGFTAATGAADAYGILAEDVKADGAAVVAPVLISGAFIADKLIGYKDEMKDALRKLNIYIVKDH